MTKKPSQCVFSFCLSCLILLTPASPIVFANDAAVDLTNSRHQAGNRSKNRTTDISLSARAPSSQISNRKRPMGTCNLPPVPAPGQTVTWTLAGSPYEICQNITIPSTSTVIVEAGVHINFDPDMQVVVLGTMQLQGQGAQHIVLQAPAVFPPIIDIDGGVFKRRSQISPARCA